jgi:chromosome segregation ATPase
MPETLTHDPLEKLKAQSTQLTADIKAKTNELKRMADEVMTAQAKAATTIKEAEATQTARLEALRAQVAPLEETVRALQSRLDAQANAYTQQIQAHQADLTTAKTHKLAQLRTLDTQLAEKAGQLTTMHQAIADCQRKVAAL